MSFQPYQTAPTSDRFRRATSVGREAEATAYMMRISQSEAEKQNELRAKSGKFGTVAPVGSSGFAGDRLASAIGSFGKAAGAIGGLLGQGGTNFNPAGNTFSGFNGGSTYRLMPDLAQYKPPNWNPSSTVFGS